MNKLEQLMAYSTIVADTGDIEAIKQFKPLDTTTNPSLLLKASDLKHYSPLLTESIEYAKKSPTQDSINAIAADKFATLIGKEILHHIDGRISTEVDARLSFDTRATIDKAKRLIDLYNETGIDQSRILIKIAATWEGIQAASILESEGIQCNLTLVFSFEQAKACADAGVFLISPFVGRILDWYKKNTDIPINSIDQDPGVKSVSDIYKYFKENGYPTTVMAASFRNIQQIQALAGCDRLTISPTLLTELQNDTGSIHQQLFDRGTSLNIKPNPILETDFRYLVNENAMATEKLAEGIRLFARDQLFLEKKLSVHGCR